MKKIKLQYSLILVFSVLITSCSSNDELSSPSGTYLTINGDTREIINGGDSKLSIRKEIFVNTGHPKIEGDSKVLWLRIYDPNKFLIANFGGYEYNSPYLIIRFALPANFTNGDYTTTEGNLLGAKQSKSLFQAKFAAAGQKFKITTVGGNLAVEFQQLKYSDAIISGRIVIN